MQIHYLNFDKALFAGKPGYLSGKLKIFTG